MTKLSDIKVIKVLFRDPNMRLWGIPYGMRPGQQPGDLYRAHRDWTPPKPGGYGSKQIRLDWVYLGSPGWWGSKSKEEQAEIKQFLAELPKGALPEAPWEWVDLEQLG